MFTLYSIAACRTNYSERAWDRRQLSLPQIRKKLMGWKKNFLLNMSVDQNMSSTAQNRDSDLSPPFLSLPDMGIKRECHNANSVCKNCYASSC